MKPSELKFSFSVESYDEKTAENYRNCYVAEEPIVSKLWKIKQTVDCAKELFKDERLSMVEIGL